MSQILNQQRKTKIDIDLLEVFADNVLAAVKEADGRDVSIVFVSDRKMKEMNGFFRDKTSVV